MNPLALSALHAAVLAVLTSTGLPIYDGKPETLGEPRAFPYAVLYRLTSLDPDGPLNDPDADRIVPFQVTYVGETREQSDAIGDAMRAALITATWVPIGTQWVVDRVEATDIGGTDRQDTADPSAFLTFDTFSFHMKGQ